MQLITFNEYLRVINDPMNNSVARKYYQSLDILKYFKITNEERYYHVEAFFDNGKYSNEINFDISKLDYSVENYKCNCPWSTEKSGCGHLGCVLLYLMNNDINTNELPYVYGDVNYKDEAIIQEQTENKIDSYFSSRLIEELENDFKLNGFRIEENKIVSLEPQVNYEYGMLNISFKIGYDKKYKIKNLGTFVYNVENKEIFKYGKFLTLTHNYENFDDTSKQVYKFIKKYADEHGEYYFDSASKKDIRIDGENIDEFNNLIDLINVKEIEFYNVESKLRVDVERRKFGYRFKRIVLEGNRIIGKNAMYTIDNHVFEKLVFYRNDYHGNKDVLKFIELLDRRDGLYISDKDVPAFNRYLMNGIKNEISISDYPLGDEADEQISIYGDIDENDTISLTIQSEIHGDRIYGFSDSNFKSALLEKTENFIANYAYKINDEEYTAYLDNNDENTFTFINEGLPLLQNYCDVYISENLKKLGIAQKYNISVGVRVDNHLLDIDFSSIDIPDGELSNVLSSYRKKKKYHKLKNGDLLYLNSEDLESLDNLLTDYDIKIKDIDNNHAKVGLFRAFSLDEVANSDENLVLNREDSFNNLIKRFKNINLQDYPIQEHYDSILRDYQKDGYKWLKCLNSYSFGGILADDMGLGKTLQVIALIESLIGKGLSIVVCPSSLILNWVDEVHKFSENIKVLGIYGNQLYRSEIIKTINEYDLIITSYDYVRRDFELYDEQKFNYIILDEAQYIKNKNTKNAKSVKMLKGTNRLALTGTPIENTLAELWSIFDFLMPGYLYNYHYFKQHFETPIVKEHDEDKEKSLKQLIQPFILRRNKKDVLKELPDKIEQNLEFVFNDEEKKLYYANLALVNESLQAQLNVQNVDKIAILAMLTRLRQICIEPRLIYDDIDTISSKMSGCLDLLGQLVENKQKVLLFSSFTSVLDLLADELDKRHYSYYKLTGSTNKTKRHQLVKDFQDDDTMIFLISLKAGGTGLNLTSAQAVIHFDPWWNVSAQNQATDRAYRIGQKNNVQVFKLIMKDSIEEKILQMQSTKKDLADAFVENNTGTITKMNVSELIDLFK